MKLDEIKYSTPEVSGIFQEITLLMGVYYYSHYLFVLAYYIKYYININDGH